VNLTRINIVLALLLVAVVLPTLVVRVDYSQPNIEILPHMKYSSAYDAFSTNPNFANGRTLQAPVSGTIARGDLPLDFAATPEDAIRAGEQLQSPFAAVDGMALSAAIEQGAEVYRIFCDTCHGAGGAGDGPVPKRGFPPPPSLLTGKSVTMKAGQLFHILTYGQGSMPTFTAQLSRENRWEVIEYIRSLQQDAARKAAIAAKSAADAAERPGPEDETKPDSQKPEGEQR